MRAISILVYSISCKFLVNPENLFESYDQVVHKREVVIIGLANINLLNLEAMRNIFIMTTLEI